METTNNFILFSLLLLSAILNICHMISNNNNNIEILNIIANPEESKIPLTNIDALISQTNFKKLPIRMSIQDKMVYAKIVLTLNTLGNDVKKRYLEWGSGGSTQLVSILPTNINAKYYSIEHVPIWCDLMLEKTIINWAINIGKLHYECVDTKQPVRNWGVPNATANISKMLKYVDVIDEFNETLYDVVLIDGRFRIECAFKLLLNNYINYDSIVMMHDYTRKRYHKVEKYYDIIDEYNYMENKTDVLAVFKVKHGYFENGTLIQQLQNDFLKYRLDYY